MGPGRQGRRADALGAPGKSTAISLEWANGSKELKIGRAIYQRREGLKGFRAVRKGSQREPPP